MFKKILIANRGEIAVRIIRACKELDIPTLAIYSDVDRESKHVEMADESVCIGAAPPSESYLNIDKILKVAKELKVDAIHPGYGFLAENPIFAEKVEKSGITFIGPNSKSMKLLGSKIESRKTMQKANVPVIPGMMTKSEDFSHTKREAAKIGYPLLIKASSGGGGKGMKKVLAESELEEAASSAMREAKKAFGDDTVYIEKFIEKPRHVEFQIVADNHGNIVHVFERECSIQRRHQKIVEESPSPALDPKLRKKMGDVAISAVQASNYNNCGTVEFLLDKDKNFYFLEVNARIQVEHPVTELVSGIDLVKTQIKIAAGEKLDFTQDDLKQTGHALEVRIYAEDPENNFLPSSGEILYLREPTGVGVRNDTGIFNGANVSVFYDPILAKLICWGENREAARKRLIAALKDYVILGIKTPIEYLINILEHKEFIKGATFTDFIEKNIKEMPKKDDLLEIALIAAGIHSLERKGYSPGQAEKVDFSPWQMIGKWEI